MLRRNLLRVYFKWTCPILRTDTTTTSSSILTTIGNPLNTQSTAQVEHQIDILREEIRKLKADIGHDISEERLLAIRQQISAKEYLLAAELYRFGPKIKKKPHTAMTLRRPEETLPKGVRHGRTSFDEFFNIVVMGFLNRDTSKPMTPQDSVGYVLTSASGVGKTVVTLTYRKGLERYRNTNPSAESRPYEALSLYLGFNGCWRLSDDEKAMLRRLKHEDAVRRVLFWRLMLSVQCLLKDVPNLEKVDDSTMMQLMPLPSLESDKEHYGVPDDDSVDVSEMRMAKMLKSLYDHWSGGIHNVPLAILAVVDEAQFLDQLIPPDKLGGKGGARFALRCLRELQVSCFNRTNGKLILLPIATGIDPCTSLDSATTGKNKSVYLGGPHDDAVLLKKDHFAELRVAHKDSRVHQVLAAVFYPRVREWLKGGAIGMSDFNIHESWPRKDTIDVIRCAYLQTGTRVISGSIPRIHTSSDKAIPILDYGCWDAMYSKLECGIDLPASWSAVDATTINRLVNDCHAFETAAFDILGFFMTIFCSEDRLRSSIRRRDSIVQRSPTLHTWLPQQTFRMHSIETLDSPTTHYHPFAELGSHEKAGKMEGPLSDSFLQALDSTPVGSGCWLHCGASAMLDFILAVQVKDGEWEIRFADAQHSVKSGVRLPAETREVLVGKGRRLHAAMSRALQERSEKAHMNPFEDTHVLGITNMKCKDAISPETFDWEPWSTILFAIPKQNNDKGPDITAGND